jgi:preprotein translocase subunit Sss1
MTNNQDALRGLIAKWLLNFTLNYTPMEFEEFVKPADQILALLDTPEGQEYLKSKGWVQLHIKPITAIGIIPLKEVKQ